MNDICITRRVDEAGIQQVNAECRMQNAELNVKFKFNAECRINYKLINQEIIKS